MTLLVTPTLLNSYEFAANAPFAWKQKANEDFVAKLRREKGTFPEWVKKGSKFEDAVYNDCMGSKTYGGQIDTEAEAFQDVVALCKGGTFQDVFKKTMIIDGNEYLIYTKMDVVFPDIIRDIKTTLSYKGAHKYLKGWQHWLYCYAAEIPKFEYVVVEWANEHGYDIAALHSAKFDAPSWAEVEAKIVSGVKDMVSFVEKEGLYDDYFYTFSNNG